MIFITVLLGVITWRRWQNNRWRKVDEIRRQDPNAPCPESGDGKHLMSYSVDHGFHYCFGCYKVWLSREQREAAQRRDSSYFPRELRELLKAL